MLVYQVGCLWPALQAQPQPLLVYSRMVANFKKHEQRKDS